MDPTVQQKIAYLNEHFVYEAQELVSCGLFHASILKHTSAMRERMLYEIFVNISLDHTLLHARNLLEFLFYKEDSDGKYARAASYVADWVRPPMTPNLSLLERRVNDEITHLGWNRLNVKPEEKSWKPFEVIDELLKITETFLSRLDQKYCGVEVERLKKWIKEGYVRYTRERDVEQVKFAKDYFDTMLP